MRKMPASLLEIGRIQKMDDIATLTAALRIGALTGGKKVQCSSGRQLPPNGMRAGRKFPTNAREGRSVLTRTKLAIDGAA